MEYGCYCKKSWIIHSTKDDELSWTDGDNQEYKKAASVDCRFDVIDSTLLMDSQRLINSIYWITIEAHLELRKCLRWHRRNICS